MGFLMQTCQRLGMYEMIKGNAIVQLSAEETLEGGWTQDSIQTQKQLPWIMKGLSSLRLHGKHHCQ